MLCPRCGVIEKEEGRDCCAECARARHREWYQKNKEKSAQRNRKYYEEHREEVNKCNQKYRAEHKEQIVEGGRKYRAEHKKKITERNRKYNAAHKEERAAYLRKTRSCLRKEMLNVYGGQCEFCGETTTEWLQLDHIGRNPEKNKNGRRLAIYTLYQRLKGRGWPRRGHRLLCSNCNQCRNNYGDEIAKERGLQKKKERIRALQRELFSERYEYPGEQVKEIQNVENR